jgi:hypothetical protein
MAGSEWGLRRQVADPVIPDIRHTYADFGEPTSELEPLTCSLRVQDGLNTYIGECQDRSVLPLKDIARQLLVFDSYWHLLGKKQGGIRPESQYAGRRLERRESALQTSLEAHGNTKHQVPRLSAHLREAIGQREHEPEPVLRSPGLLEK